MDENSAIASAAAAVDAVAAHTHTKYCPKQHSSVCLLCENEWMKKRNIDEQ